MFFRKVTTRRRGKEYVYLKLIESYREGGRVKQRVIANLGNVEYLAPEKVEVLINSLGKFCSSGKAKGTLFNERVSVSSNLSSLQAYRRTWCDLGLDKLFNKTFNDLGLPESSALLVEAVTILCILDPEDVRPIATRFKELGFSGVGDRDIPGIEFYRTIAGLSEIVPAVENWLFQKLQTKLGSHGQYIFLQVIPAEFIGYECGITTTGLNYHIKPYRRKVWLLVTVYPGGCPIACRLVPGDLTPEVVIEARVAIEKATNTTTYIIYDGEELIDKLNLPRFITCIPLRYFSKVSFENIDPWRENGIIEGNLWLKTIGTETGRYIICYNLEPNAASDQELEVLLAQAVRELDKIKAQVRQKRLVTEASVLKRAARVLQELGCQEYFDCHFSKGNFHYGRREEVIKKVKTIRRTQVLRVDLEDASSRDIVAAYRSYATLRQEMAVIYDQTRLPVVYPYADYQHSAAFIAGQAMVYVLAKVVRHLTGLMAGAT